MFPLKNIRIGKDTHAITGRKKNKKGYVLCLIKTHPFSGKDNYVFEHRLIVEEYIGSYLLPGKVVHHKNGIKDDNRIENLEVLDNAAHTVLTHKGLKRGFLTRKRISDHAKKRFSDKKNHPEYVDVPKDEMITDYRSIGASKTAKKYNVTKRTIYNRLHEWGVELNNVK